MNLAALPTVYSVFNYRTGLFDYYVPPEQPLLPASGHMRPARGTTPESLAVLLPPGCTPQGSGEAARGVIAAHPTKELGALGDASTNRSGSSWAFLLGAVAAVLWVSRSKR